MKERKMIHTKRTFRTPYVIVMISLTLFSTGLFAQTYLPVSFSPAVGDTLDAVEERQLKLFSGVDQFLWAVFLVKEEGGNLWAKVGSVVDRRLRLQIANLGFTPEFVRKKIEVTFGGEIKMVVSGRRSRTRFVPNQAVDKIVIVSPRVGKEIDLDERRRFGMFLSLSGFERAVFFQTPDSAYYASIELTGTDKSRADTCIEFSKGVMRQLAERIDHYEGLLAGTYKMHLTQDTSGVQGPMAELPPLPSSHDEIPLAINTANLSRPLFHTTHLDIGVGFLLADLSGIQKVIGGSTVAGDTASPGSQGSPSMFLSLSAFLHVPLLEEPSVSLIAGGGIAFGEPMQGTFLTYSVTLLFESHSIFLPFDPIIGIGIGHNRFSYEGSVIVDVSASYPTAVLGLNVIPNVLNVLATIPLITKNLKATFESRDYTIRPAGTAVTLFVCL